MSAFWTPSGSDRDHVGVRLSAITWRGTRHDPVHGGFDIIYGILHDDAVLYFRYSTAAERDFDFSRFREALEEQACELDWRLRDIISAICNSGGAQ